MIAKTSVLEEKKRVTLAKRVRKLLKLANKNLRQMVKDDNRFCKFLSRTLEKEAEYNGVECSGVRLEIHGTALSPFSCLRLYMNCDWIKNGAVLPLEVHSQIGDSSLFFGPFNPDEEKGDYVKDGKIYDLEDILPIIEKLTTPETTLDALVKRAPWHNEWEDMVKRNFN